MTNELNTEIRTLKMQVAKLQLESKLRRNLASELDKQKQIAKNAEELANEKSKEIEEIASLGLLDGVTTNPSLVAKENGQQDFATIIKKICKIAKGPVSAEVISTEFENMIKEAEILSKIDKNVVIK